MRVVESLLGGVIAAVFTRSFVIAAIVVVCLFIAWETGRYGRFAETDRRVLRELNEKGKVDHGYTEEEEAAEAGDTGESGG